MHDRKHNYKQNAFCLKQIGQCLQKPDPDKKNCAWGELTGNPEKGVGMDSLSVWVSPELAEGGT